MGKPLGKTCWIGVNSVFDFQILKLSCEAIIELKHLLKFYMLSSYLIYGSCFFICSVKGTFLCSTSTRKTCLTLRNPEYVLSVYFWLWWINSTLVLYIIWQVFTIRMGMIFSSSIWHPMWKENFTLSYFIVPPVAFAPVTKFCT